MRVLYARQSCGAVVELLHGRCDRRLATNDPGETLVQEAPRLLERQVELSPDRLLVGLAVTADDRSATTSR